MRENVGDMRPVWESDPLVRLPKFLGTLGGTQFGGRAMRVNQQVRHSEDVGAAIIG